MCGHGSVICSFLLLNSMPFTDSSHCIPQLTNIWVFPVWDYVKQYRYRYWQRSIWRTYIFTCFEQIPGSRTARLYGKVMFTFWRNCRLFSKARWPLHSPEHHQGSSCPFCPYACSHSGGCEVVCTSCGLTLHFPNDYDVEYLLMSVLVICTSSLQNVQTFCQLIEISNWFTGLLCYYSVASILHVLLM